MDPKIRIILAAAGAAAGLGLAIYLGYNALGAGRTVRSADQAARAQPSPSAAPAEGPSTGQRVACCVRRTWPTKKSPWMAIPNCAGI